MRVAGKDLVEVLPRDAKEAAKAIDERLSIATGPVQCLVQGLVRAAAGSLEQAEELSSDGCVEGE